MTERNKTRKNSSSLQRREVLNVKFKKLSNYQLHKTGFPSCVRESGQTVAMFIVKKQGLAVIAGCIQPGQALGIGQVHRWSRPAKGQGRPGKRAHLQCATMRMRRSPLRVNYIQMAECLKPVITSQVAGINRSIALYIIQQ